MTEYRFADLLDLTILQNTADAHQRATGMSIAIIDVTTVPFWWAPAGRTSAPSSTVSMPSPWSAAT